LEIRAILAPNSAADAAKGGQPDRRGTRELSLGALGVVMNLPTMCLLLLVLAYPVVYAGYLSLHQVGIAQLRRGVFPWNNWQNYTRLFEDPLFALALKNTVLFTVLVVAVELILAIAIALLINQASLWTSRLTRLLILIPYGVPPITNGLIWSFMYSFQFGFLNRVLFSLGLINDPVNWAGNPNTALYAVAVAYIWRTLPFAVLIIHAALQGIPRELHEAATVDGGSAWQRFRWITLPLLAPVIVVILILRTSFAFAVFEEILAITQGGPGDASYVAAWYSYKLTFSPPNNVGMGAASAYVLALLVGLFAIAYVRLIYRRIT
jgi:multiple sugar transport system permease protein